MFKLRSTDPRQIGTWEVIGRLGEGGQGVVYLAARGEEKAAIKVFKEAGSKFPVKELDASSPDDGMPGRVGISGVSSSDAVSGRVTGRKRSSAVAVRLVGKPATTRCSDLCMELIHE